MRPRWVLIACLLVTALGSLATIAFVGLPITPDRVMTMLTVQKYRIQSFRDGTLRFVVSAVATDDGWGPYMVAVDILRNDAPMTNHAIHLFRRAPAGGVKPFALKRGRNHDFFVITDSMDDSRVVLIFDGTTGEIWPYDDGEGGNSHERMWHLKGRLVQKAVALFGPQNF